MIACDSKGCGVAPDYECACPRCAREPAPQERFHACLDHLLDVELLHLQIRERPVTWAKVS